MQPIVVTKILDPKKIKKYIKWRNHPSPKAFFWEFELHTKAFVWEHEGRGKASTVNLNSIK